MQHIGFIGLGAMGKPMAKNLIRKGTSSVQVYDLNQAAVQELVEMGAKAAKSIGTLASECDVIITMLPNSPDVEKVVLDRHGIANNIKQGAIYIDMSTIDPAVTKKLAEIIEGKGGKMLDAPVGRTTAHAEEGTLSIMVGGDEALFTSCQSLLGCMGTDLIYCGPIGSGETMKIVNNLLTGIIVTANAEALSLGVKAGLKLETMLDVLRSTAANNGHLNITFPTKALKGDFTPGFATRLAYKDMNLAISIASQHSIPLMLGSASAQLFNMARGLGRDNDDYTSVITVLEQFGGIQVRQVE